MMWPPAVLEEGNRPRFSPEMAAYVVRQMLHLVTVTSTAPDVLLQQLSGARNINGHIVLPHTGWLAQAAADTTRLQTDQDVDVVLMLDGSYGDAVRLRHLLQEEGYR